MNTAWEVGDVGEGNQGVAAAASEISDHDFRVLFTTRCGSMIPRPCVSSS